MTQTIKVMPWGKDQGDHVLINESDFDPAKHKPVDAAPEAVKAAKPKKPAAAAPEAGKD